MCPTKAPHHVLFRAWWDGVHPQPGLLQRAWPGQARPVACNTSLIGCMHLNIQVHRRRCLVALICFVFCAFCLSLSTLASYLASAGPGSWEMLDFHVPCGPGSSCTTASVEPGPSTGSWNQTTQSRICWAWIREIHVTKRTLSFWFLELNSAKVLKS